MHFSNPLNALQYHSPALAGANGKFGSAAIWRDQWNAAGTPFKTRMLLADYAFGHPRYNKVLLSLGGIAYRDEAAQGNFGSSGFSGQISCAVKTGDKTRLCSGMGAGFVQLSNMGDRLSWQSQFNGYVYDPGIESGENIQSSKRNYADVHTGVSFIYDERTTSPPQRASHFILAYGLAHINAPAISTRGTSDRLLPKHSLLFSAHINAKNNISFKPVFLAMMQGSMKEFNAGMLMKYSLGQSSRYTGINKGSSISFGGMYRLNDAVIPMFEFERGRLAFNFSYDINNSELSQASNYRGGFEVAIRYQAGVQQINARGK